VRSAEGGFGLVSVPLSSAAGRPSDQLSKVGTFAESVRPGGYDPDARLAAMATDGVDAEVVYPSVAMRLYAFPDLDYRVACFRAYNRWLADFSAAHPDRLKGIGMVGLDDPEAAARELEEIKRLGLAGAMISIRPGDGATYAAPEYEPFWAAAERLDLPVSLHIRRITATNAAQHYGFA
jgi:predicted TIM-barrel fold metal-dependent hydrolase